MRRVRIRLRSLEDRSYTLHIGTGILRALPRALPSLCPAARYALVSDRTVARLHGRALLAALRRAGLRADLIAIPEGERFKTRRTKERVEDSLARLGCGRDSAIVALGGGVVGDLAGFVAATWQRGVPYIQVPTTLLAMLDASVGGKTAVDHPRGKNLIGAFHQPAAVWADVAALRTLPERQFRAGLAEAVKHAAVADAGLLRFLEWSGAALSRRRPGALEPLVERNCRIKAQVVQRDEREGGWRQILNFGHTIAHALETCAGYRLLHGEAVAVGMAVEAHLSSGLGGLLAEERDHLVRLIERLGLPTRLPRGIDPRRIVASTYADKKARAGRPLYALIRRLGGPPSWKGRPVVEAEDAAVLEALRSSV
jgi:3-dehydroquinate synthase